MPIPRRYRNGNEYFNTVSVANEIYRDGNYISPQTIIIARTAKDIPLNPSGDTACVIDGVIDMGDKEITVSESGVEFIGNGDNLSKLFSSSNNYTMFKKGSGYSGDFIIGGSGLSIEVTGTSSKVFDLDNEENSNIIDIEHVKFKDCTSLGTTSNYRELLNINIEWENCTDGLEVDGVWSNGCDVLSSRTNSLPASCTLFKAGASLDIQGSFVSDLDAISVNAATTLFDFAPSDFSLDGGFRLDNFRTTATNPTPNFPHESVKAYFTKCKGLENTYPGGEWDVSSEVATALSGESTGVFLKAAGTTTYSNLSWFTGAASNAMTLAVDDIVDFQIIGSMSFSGSNNHVLSIKLRQWDDSAGSYIDLGTPFNITLNSGGRAESVSIMGFAALEKDDRIEVWIADTTSPADATMLLNGTLLVTERAS